MVRTDPSALDSSSLARIDGQRQPASGGIPMADRWLADGGHAAGRCASMREARAASGLGHQDLMAERHDQQSDHGGEDGHTRSSPSSPPSPKALGLGSAWPPSTGSSPRPVGTSRSTPSPALARPSASCCRLQRRQPQWCQIMCLTSGHPRGNHHGRGGRGRAPRGGQVVGKIKLKGHKAKDAIKR
jgi:hypothetical protein